MFHYSKRSREEEQGDCEFPLEKRIRRLNLNNDTNQVAASEIQALQNEPISESTVHQNIQPPTQLVPIQLDETNFYAPELTAHQNPHYYLANKALFEVNQLRKSRKASTQQQAPKL